MQKRFVQCFCHVAGDFVSVDVTNCVSDESYAKRRKSLLEISDDSLVDYEFDPATGNLQLDVISRSLIFLRLDFEAGKFYIRGKILESISGYLKFVQKIGMKLIDRLTWGVPGIENDSFDETSVFDTQISSLYTVPRIKKDSFFAKIFSVQTFLYTS